MEKLYKASPQVIQNLMITTFNFLAYRKRYGGKYKKFRILFKERDSLSLAELKNIQEENYNKFKEFVIQNSPYYKKKYFENNESFPIITKEEIRQNISDIRTISERCGIVIKTGGTTGKSMEVVFTNKDMQERFAMLDNFRSKHGYKLGKKTVWLSGKSLLTDGDIKKHIFWKTDYLYKVRYYSTFHLKANYLRYYVENLLKFKPEFIVGIASSIHEIAKFGIKNGYDFPANTVKAIFPTAETVPDEMRKNIETFFKADVYNQYASSEGAPFILECKNHKLHLELQSGIFEVLDEANKPTQKGRLVLTSFTTHGTPLVRYDIGDVIELSDETCTCGNHNPVVCDILGRLEDFIYSPDTGKIASGNSTNTLKGTKGIIKFQVIQDQVDAIKVLMIVDPEIYDVKMEALFLSNWRDRIGNNMSIELSYVDDIPNERSGKYRVLKNNIKHLLVDE